MQTVRMTARDLAEDLFFGQEVLIWARWFLITALAILALWTATTSSELALAALPIAALMGMNFFFHGRHAMGRPANRTLVALASLIDVAIVTSIVLFWDLGTVEAGFASPFFILCYPALLAFAFVFPPRQTAICVGMTLALYVGACVLAPDVSQAPVVDSALELKGIIFRVITMASVGALGTFYWRIQRDRLRTVTGRSPSPTRSARPEAM